MSASGTASNNTVFPFGQPIVWHPPADTSDLNLVRFMKRHGLDDYPSLYRRSTEDVAWFWDAALKDLGIEFRTPYETIVDLSNGIEFPEWCVGGRMNIVDNCIDKWLREEATSERPAIRWEGEDGATRMLTYRELHEEVCRCANGLKSLGIGKGDVVGLFMPMCPEIVIAFLAIAKIGAIILPLFSGYGVSAVVSRLQDAGAKALFTSDGFRRRGRTIAMKTVADEAAEQCPSLEHVIVHRYLAEESDIDRRDDRDIWWHDFISDQPADALTEDTAAEDVVMLIYTSGTTGRPKGAVHTHCGFPLKAAQDMYHCMDLRPGETMYWMSDMGWMMGPWLVFGTLCIGASMVLYDGAPDFPDTDRVWEIVQRHGVTHLGVSPTLIRALKVYGDEPVRRHDVSSLRAAGSTGSPWDPESWRWLFETVLEGNKPILNYSGGTEISGGILCGNFLQPLKPCAFSGPVPGMAADVVDADGSPVRGEVGELVIRRPWIGMTRGFWNDRERYLASYWSRFEGIWTHGDFAAIDDDGLWYILGRSDDTIKVAGKRLGPAEVEAVLNAAPDVAESAVIGVPDDVKGQSIVAFVVLKATAEPSEKLRNVLMKRVTDELGKPLKPKDVRFCDALPKTRNAKVMRRLIRSAFLGQDLGDTSSLEDPAAVDAITQSR